MHGCDSRQSTVLKGGEKTRISGVGVGKYVGGSQRLHATCIGVWCQPHLQSTARTGVLEEARDGMGRRICVLELLDTDTFSESYLIF